LGNLYDQIHTWDNLYLAWRKAARGKRGREPAASFEFHLEDNLLQLQEELQDKTYRPGPYHSFYIHDPKHRLGDGPWVRPWSIPGRAYEIDRAIFNAETQRRRDFQAALQYS